MPQPFIYKDCGYFLLPTNSNLGSKVQTGTAYVSYGLYSWGWTHVTFPIPFSSLPYVGITSAPPERHTWRIANVSTTGFDIGGWHAYSTADKWDTDISWVATN